MQFIGVSSALFSVSPSVSIPVLSPSSYPRCGVFNLASNQNLSHGFPTQSLKMASGHRIASTSYRCSVGVRCGAVEVDDGFYMRRCVELARKAIGFTSPNPMVGCVIVRDDEIVGQGFHPKAGQPHAEVFALRDAGDLAEGATAYVSLEPCNHFGRTPPCTEALIKAKVKKVVIGMVDPNPVVASSGVDRLRDAGIDVTIGVEEELCRKINEAYIHQMLSKKPFLTLRYSMSINGCFLDNLGEEVSEPGGYYSKLLQEYDAIILSSSLMDNLSGISSKELGANQPVKIIVPSGAQKSPIQVPSNLAEDLASNVVIFTEEEMADELDKGNSRIETVLLDKMNLDSILEYCKRRGFCSVLLDLRGNIHDLEVLLRDGIEQKQLQKILVEVLPVWNIDNNKNPLRSEINLLPVKSLQSKSSGGSILLEGYL